MSKKAKAARAGNGARDADRTPEAVIRQLQSRIEDLETVLRVLPIGVGISTDASCRHITMNPALAEMLGLEKTRNMSLTAPPGEAPTAFEVWSEGRKLKPDELPMQTAARENREVRNFPEVIVRKDGRKLYVTSDSIPLHAPDGSVRGVAAAFRDVTEAHNATEERVAMERRLVEAQQAEKLGLLAAGIAHDFNNMLSIVMGSSELARMDIDPESPVQEHMAMIEATVRRAGDLCQQLLAYSGQGRFVVQPLNLNTAVRETLALLKPTILFRHTVEVDLAKNAPLILADAAQMQQILLNLLTNASEACEGRRGRLGISTARIEVDQRLAASTVPEASLAPGTCVRLRISDNGPGMRANVLSKVFNPFFSTKFTGRGLGLPVVLGIARGHNGGVHIKTKPGSGTTVDVYIPEAEQPAQADEVIPAAGKPSAYTPAGTLSGRVLVVDDEQILRRSLSVQLRNLGLDVDSAADGIEALELMEQNEHYDLVILDVTMPRLGGFETLDRIREQWENTRAIVVSGFAPQKVAEEFARLKPDAIVAKPFVFSHLQREVVRILGQSR